MPKHECRWRTAADELARELETERAARAVADAKLASALTQIADYEKRLFGRTTERVIPIDRELRDSDATSRHEATGDSDGKSTTKGEPKRKKKPRPEDAPGLRQETVEHPVSERVRKCPYCGETAQPIGTGKFTTEWDYVPGYFVRRRHIQEVVACPCG